MGVGRQIMSEEWKDRANCQGQDTEQFFAEQSSYPNRQLLIRICNACEVQTECLEYAIKNNMDGWWANTGQREREKLKLSLQKSTSHRG